MWPRFSTQPHALLKYIHTYIYLYIPYKQNRSLQFAQSSDIFAKLCKFNATLCECLAYHPAALLQVVSLF